MKFDTNNVLCYYRIINIRRLQNCVADFILQWNVHRHDELFTFSYVVFWFITPYTLVSGYQRFGEQLPLAIYTEGNSSAFF
jgi:hypothetical protein